MSYSSCVSHASYPKANCRAQSAYQTTHHKTNHDQENQTGGHGVTALPLGTNRRATMLDASTNMSALFTRAYSPPIMKTSESQRAMFVSTFILIFPISYYSPPPEYGPQKCKQYRYIILHECGSRGGSISPHRLSSRSHHRVSSLSNG